MVLVAVIVVAVAKYEVRNQDAENVEFYVIVLGREIRSITKLAGCTTEPWYDALDGADFYAMALPDDAFSDPPESYPKKMDYHEDHDLVGNLLKGEIGRFSVDKLIDMLTRAGMRIRLETEPQAASEVSGGSNKPVEARDFQNRRG